MRIGIDYRPALVNREGIGRYTRELVRGLLQLDIEEELGLFGTTLAQPRFSPEELGIAGTRADLRRKRLPARVLPWLLALTGRGVDDLAGGADVYHHTQPNLLRVRKAKQVVTIFDCIYTLDADPEVAPGFLSADAARSMTKTAKRMVQAATRILVPCGFVGGDVVVTLGANPARVCVTPLGCDHVLEYLPAGGFPPPNDPYVLTVGRVDPRKNHMRILTTFERLVREGLAERWIIAGPPGFGCEGFEAALENSAVRDRVQWLRFVPEEELVRLYAGCDLLLWPSLNEGFGLPPLEAMACGAPVLASAVTSMPEVCGNAAYLVDPTDVDAIFEAARDVLSSQETSRELRKRGAEQAARFTWKECARSTLASYRAAAVDDGSERSMVRLF